MKRLKILFLMLGILIFLTGFLNNLSHANNIHLEISVTNDSLKHFYFSLSNFFETPEEKIIIIKKKYHPIIKDEEIPIILILAKEAKVDPQLIVELRKKGYSWYEIFVYFGIKPEKFYRTVIIKESPPYGKAWGYYKKPKKIKKVFISDGDIIVLTHVKFISEYFQENPKEVWRMFEITKNPLETHEKFFIKHYKKVYK